jgi:hypothetical protein
MTALAPLTQNFKVVEQTGEPSVEFKTFTDDLIDRSGGISGGKYDQLSIASGVALWDVDRNPIIVVVLTENITIPTPSNMVAGFLYPYRITLVQDTVGGRTVSWGSGFKFPSAVPPALTAAPNAVDELWFSTDGTNMKLCVLSKDLR